MVRTRPDLVPVLHSRASAWFEQVGDLELATDHRPTGSEGQPRTPAVLRVDYLRAVTGVNDVGRAEEAGRRAAAAAPSAPWEGMAWCGVGQALYLQDRYDEARVCLHRSVALTPDTNPIMLSVARANLALVEAASATEPVSDRVLHGTLELLRRTGADNTPSAALVEMAWGEVRRTQGELQDAVVHFEASLEHLGVGTLSGFHANAFLRLARVQHELRDSALALRSLDAADSILRRQRDPGALPERARLLRQTWARRCGGRSATGRCSPSGSLWF